MTRGYRSSTVTLIILLTGALALTGCDDDGNGDADSGGGGTDSGLDGSADGDADGDSDGDGDADGGDVGTEDADQGDPCAPQDAEEDPSVDCDCDPCDRTPYLWNGSDCVYSPLCCCTGADCGSRYGGREHCLSDYDSCDIVEPTPTYPDARLIWDSDASVSNGPMLMIDGLGNLRLWGNNDQFPVWSAGEDDHSESLGVETANTLLDMLLAIDIAGLPHDPEAGTECTSGISLTECGSGCDGISMGYQRATELAPEFDALYAWLDERLCARPEDLRLPGEYCLGF